jgi:hypothetical protein
MALNTRRSLLLVTAVFALFFLVEVSILHGLGGDPTAVRAW